MGARSGGGASGGMGSGSRSAGDASMRHLSAAAQKSFKKEEESIRRQGVEYGIVMDEKGNVIWKGTDNSDAHVHYGTHRNNRITVHNHPIQGQNKGRDRLDNGGSFSKADLMNAANGNALESRVVTQKYTFSIRRPASGWKSSASNEGAYRRAKARVDRRIKKYYQATKNDWETAGRRVLATYWHLVAKEYAKAQGYTYTKTKIH